MADNNQDNQQPENAKPAGENPEGEVKQPISKEEGTPENGGEEDKEGKPEEKPEDKRPRKNRFQERFNEITAKRRVAETDAGSVRDLIQDITGESVPKPSDFKTAEEYNAAMAELREKLAPYKAMQAKSERTIQSIDQEYMQTLADSWEEKAADAAKEISDWRTVVSAAKIPMTQELTMAVMESTVGPQIAYYLAKNPDEAFDILSLSPVGQARRIGQLESKIQAGGIKPPAPPVSQAKPPVAPVNGDGAKPKPNLGSNMSLDEYRRARGLIK